jgi:uncharacterized membrane protein YdjX (TVP38/TMEM64 family)
VLALGFAAVVRPGRVEGVIRTALASRWFPVALLGLFALRPLLAWPVSLLGGLAGYRYGLVAVPIAVVGTAVPSLLPFYAGRRLPTGDGVVGRAAAAGRRCLDDVGDVRGVVAARFAPTPAPAISAACGAVDLPAGRFLLGTVAGQLPWIVGGVLVGRSLARFDADALAGTGALAVVLALVAAALVARPLLARWRA